MDIVNMMTSYEQNFNPLPAVAFAANNWLVPIAIVTAYILFVFIVPSIMATRKPFDLEKPLAAWNGLLCVFSTIGLCKTVRRPRCRHPTLFTS
jgi:hypothetical protein